MSRSLKKGPFTDAHLVAKVAVLSEKNDKKVVKKMQDGGSPMRVMTRDEVQAMWRERQIYLSELLKELRK